MKLSEFRLYKLKIYKDEEVIFEDMAEALPEELKELEPSSIVLESGEAIIKL